LFAKNITSGNGNSRLSVEKKAAEIYCFFFFGTKKGFMLNFMKIIL